jgi:cellulose synthase/poly-beta-1,6-N-acetylglucosamine synthase-like glycosyltransferase
MRTVAWALLATPGLLLLYAYLLYPLLLRLLGAFRPSSREWEPLVEWPHLSILVPCYNEERSIGATIEALLALDYPADRRQILIVSDASTDRTDDVVRAYAAHGVELLRLSARGGKTAAENAALPILRGDIVVHTDATIRIVPGALKRLVAAFQDPTVGVASGRDVSVGDLTADARAGESGYVGYEMSIRALETRLGTIIGASGCFFADRRVLYDGAFPEALSRDFASCLIAREQGYRSVSVDAARALVPRSASPRAEFHRKIRTMARGLATLHFKRRLMNPIAHGAFAFMLFSHKLCRWLVQATLPLAAVGLVLLGLSAPSLAPWVLGGVLLAAAVAVLTYRWPDDRPLPFVLSTPGYVLLSNLAGVIAWLRFFRGVRQPVWEPTRRPVTTS